MINLHTKFEVYLHRLRK